MCGALSQARPADSSDIEVGGKTVIQGVVTASGSPVPSAYVRLLDASGEFTAEVVSSEAGQFRFFAAPGSWTVRALSTRGNGQVDVAADKGVNEANLALAH